MDQRPALKGRLKNLVGRPVLLAGACLVVLAGCQASDSNSSTFSLSGTIEVTEVFIRSEVAGKLMQLEVEQGDLVEAGQLLGTIDHEKLEIQRAEREADLELARIQLTQAERELELTRQRVQSHVQEAEASLAYARSRLELALAGEREEERANAAEEVREVQASLKKAEEDLRRMERLVSEGVLAQERLDGAQAVYDQTFARFRAAQNRRSMMVQGTRKEDIDAARAQERSAQAELAMVRADLSLIPLKEEDVALGRGRVEKAARRLDLIEAQIRDAFLYSPIVGVVAEKFQEPGEVVTVGMPIVSVSDLRKVWLWVYVPEQDLGRIRLRDEASVEVDSYPGRQFPGRVVFIRQEAEFTPKNIQTKEERVNLVFGAKVEVNNPDGILKPGLPADALLIRR